jgi:hypothetical protein
MTGRCEMGGKGVGVGLFEWRGLECFVQADELHTMCISCVPLWQLACVVMLLTHQAPNMPARPVAVTSQGKIMYHPQ